MSNRLVPNMGIPVRQVNRYLSLIKSRFRRDGALRGAPRKTTRFIGLPA
ncbi:hypothetical protein QO058_08805 [Bosea vestrisii]|nr:hypothetical protein [Bosea vestrisii]WID98318.1 hypothetical protein QO058_08805 [Bosea vestrisii]